MIAGTIGFGKYCLKHMAKWSKPEKRKPQFPLGLLGAVAPDGAGSDDVPPYYAQFPERMIWAAVTILAIGGLALFTGMLLMFLTIRSTIAPIASLHLLLSAAACRTDRGACRARLRAEGPGAPGSGCPEAG